MGENNISKQVRSKPFELFKGLYSRVARDLGVDRSYVSRVAQGERRSERVESALRAELRRIEKELRGIEPPKGNVRKGSVLVVDDEENIANTVAQILQEHGFQTQVAYGGREAIRKVLENCPETIVADVMMPQVNGIEAAKAIREMCPDTRILLFSGAMTHDLLQTARAQGYSFEILPKPIEPDTLVNKVRGNGPDFTLDLPN